MIPNWNEDLKEWIISNMYLHLVNYLSNGIEGETRAVL